MERKTPALTQAGCAPCTTSILSPRPQSISPPDSFLAITPFAFVDRRHLNHLLNSDPTVGNPKPHLMSYM